jgi:rare lipoprotein A
VTAALAGGTGVGQAAGRPAAAAKPVVSDAALASLQHQLDGAAALADQTGQEVLRSDAASASLRIALDDVAAQKAQAQDALNATTLQIYELSPPAGAPDLDALVIDPGAMQGLTAVGNVAAVGARTALAQAAQQSAQVAALTKASDKLRADLVAKAVRAYAAQDKARALIAQMQAALEAQARAARAAKDKAARDAAAARLKALAAAQARLDAQAEQLSLATSPTLTAAGKVALARQKPLLDTLVAAGPGYPAGYHLTGASITGTASWYGPGFVGRPTSSGVPYDPELLTCAMLAVPLGTVVHVTNLANNASVNVLVSDHGPYVGNRVIDLSHAAAVAVGNSGLATVRIDVMAPGTQ